MSEIILLIDQIRQHPIVESLLRQGLTFVANRTFAILKARSKDSPDLSDDQIKGRITRLEHSLEELVQTVAVAERSGTWI